jgi:lipoyl(octanoyl) transferase
LQFWSLTDFISYEKARKLQHDLVELRYQDLIPDTFLFLEHQPVVTRGRGLQFTGVKKERHIPLLAPLPPEIGFSESERGGDLTYHGPGQWVVYPICKLDGKGFAPERDVTSFLRKLENLFIEELLSHGLKAHSEAGATGIWIEDKKVASIGIAIKKWVSYHGLALNCVNDLQPFQLISPCGFSSEVMTRLKDWMPLGADWRQVLEKAFIRRVASSQGSLARSLSVDEALAIVDRANILLESSNTCNKTDGLTQSICLDILSSI